MTSPDDKPSKAEGPILAFECNVVGTGWKMIVNHTSQGRAKSTYLLALEDGHRSVAFTDVRCRKLGPAYSSKEFLRVAAERGMPHLRCGMRVAAGGLDGFIVGHDYSDRFKVLFAEGSRLAGVIRSVHPNDLRLAEAHESADADEDEQVCEGMRA